MRILVVEDEKKVARFIERGLKEERFAVDVASDGEEGLFLAQSNPYDLIVLDVLMPKKDGFQVLIELRAAQCRARILMLTARDSVQDRVQGLDSGTDDYLVKPFAFAEFLARVRSLLRRGTEGGPVSLSALDLALDLKTRKVNLGSLSRQRLFAPPEAPELAQLATAFNELLDRLEAAARQPVPLRGRRLARAAHTAHHPAR